MLLLGHMGITLAVVQVVDCALIHRKHLFTEEIQEAQQYEEAQSSKPGLIAQIDIRLLLLGSILPDIIDKPLGHIILRDSLDNGRIYCHTLLFAIIISLAAFYLWKYKNKGWLFPVAFGVFMHLILDEMWLMHHTLLWPLYGLSFPKGDWDFYWGEILHKSGIDPGLYIPEIIGGSILVLFAILIVRRKHVHTFIRDGCL